MNIAKHTILFVDDEKEVCEEFGVFLRRKGFEVITALNALDAIRHVRNHEDIHLVITDYHMPEVNGIELMRELKKIRPDLPVILVSGVADMKTGLQALKEDAFDFLAKPVDSPELLAVISKALDRAQRKILEKEDANSNIQYVGLLTHASTGKNNNISAITIMAPLDEVNLKRLNHSFDKLLAEETVHKRIVLLLNQVNYINNVGLNFLIDLYEGLRKKKYIVVLSMLSDPVYKYLKALGYLDYFEVASTLTEAIELFE